LVYCRIEPGGEKINRILAVRNDRFGEFLLTIPAFQGLKAEYPRAKLTLAVDNCVYELAKRLPFVDELLTWENRRHRLPEILKFSRELKKKKYDACLIFNPSKEFNIISWLAGIPVRAGYDRKCAFLLNRRIEDKKSEGLKHEVEYNLEFLKTIGIRPELLNNVSLRGRSEATDEAILMEIKEDDFPLTMLAGLGLEDKGFAVIHPWASNKQKEWPAYKFQEVCRKLATEIKVVVIGGKEERNRSVEFCRGLKVIDLTGQTTLLELGGLLKRSRMLLTNDSGPMHLAAILGIPVAAIFRKSPPGVSAKRWGPVGNRNIVIENETIADISVDEVIDEIKKII